MTRFQVNVLFEEGIHARPAAQLIQICQKSSSEIQMFNKDKKANPKSIMGVLSLGVSKNDIIDFEIAGADEMETAQAIKDFFTKI